MKPPQSIQSLQSFNGMINNLRRFSPVLTELSEPLRRYKMRHSLGMEIWATDSLWKDQDYTDYTSSLDIIWQRQGSHHTDWCIKDWTWCNLITSRSTHSLCIQSIDRHKVRYSNIERELLGVVFGLERLHHYTFEKSITVETDHQPLTSIWKKTLATKLQRLFLRLAQYDVYIEYLWGKENVIADALSRVAPLKLEPQECNTSLNNIEKIPIHQITQSPPASPERLQEICEAISKDQTLKLLVKIVAHGGGPKWSESVPTVHSHTGISEVKSHTKMVSYTKESDWSCPSLNELQPSSFCTWDTMQSIKWTSGLERQSTGQE